MKPLMLLITILFIHGCTIFEKEETLLAEHTKTTGEKISIYYVGLGATTTDVIQIRKNGVNKPLWVNDKYNCLNSSRLINDSSLQIVLSDTGYHNRSKMDTLIVNVK
jgi:hypothetical protein